MNRSVITMAIVASLAFAATIVLRLGLLDPQAKVRRARKAPDEAIISPGPEVMRLVSLEYAHAVADLLWLGVVQELGHKPSSHDAAAWDRIERAAILATDLDPHYFTIYYTVAVQLTAWARRGEASDRLLKKGLSHIPDRWEFPFLLGYNAYFLHGDPTAAADMWESAVPMTDSPRFMPSLAARARFQSGDEMGAIAVLESMLPFLDGPHRIDAEIRLKLLRSEGVLRDYDEACRAFVEKFGRHPKDGEEIFKAALAHEQPFDLLGDPIEIDDKCRARTSQISVREDEARERIGSQRMVKTSTAT